MSSSSENSFTRNVRRFARDVREIFLDFLRWDEEDETAAQAANISAIEDPSSSSVMLPAGCRLACDPIRFDLACDPILVDF